MSVERSPLQRARELLDLHQLDCLLITDPDNRFYVSGYLADDHGSYESSGVLLVGKSDAFLLTSPNNTAWAAEKAPDFNVKAWTRPWEATAAAIIEEQGWQSIGFEAESMTVASRQRLDERLDGQTFTPIGASLDRCRWVKTEGEIERIASTFEITDAALLEVLGRLEPAMTERHVSKLIAAAFLRLGADGEAFPTIVAAGPNAARPHHLAGDRPIQEGEPVIIDMGAKLHGYCADLTRTIVLGEADERFRTIYDTVLRAQQAALGAVRTGVPANEVDEAASSVIVDGGLGDFIIHGVGHGLGIRVHDGPSVNKRSTDPLEARQVITIEPGVYIPDWGGVRIEDVVVVQDRGHLNLTTAPKEHLVIDIGGSKR
jgi:Xaa-Pro aminopeptidase